MTEEIEFGSEAIRLMHEWVFSEEEEMSETGWIDASERKPEYGQEVAGRTRDTGSVVAGKFLKGAITTSWAEWRWYGISYWMPLPPLPGEEPKALLHDVFGGEWEEVMPNAYDCGNVHATVREHMVQVEYMTDATTLCVTVHYEEGESTREALEEAQRELRGVVDGVEWMVGELPTPAERLREWLEDKCKCVEDWRKHMRQDHVRVIDSVLRGVRIDALEATDLEAVTGIPKAEWLAMQEARNA